MNSRAVILFIFISLAFLCGAGCKKESAAAPDRPQAEPERAARLEPAPPEATATADAAGGAGAQVQVRIGGHGEQPMLSFEIVQVYEKQKPTEKAPFHADGGKWTYFDAKLADGTAFTVGLFERTRLKSEPPMTLVDAQLHSPSNEAGARLALAYAKAFHCAVPAPRNVAGPAVLKVSSVNLGENVGRLPGGGFGEAAGSWTASKWTIERAEHAAEVYFNFSLAKKKGEWSQKDADYDADVAKDFMEVLHDGVVDSRPAN